MPPYVHHPIPGLDLKLSTEEGAAIIGATRDPEALEAMDLAIYTVELARRLGVKRPVPYCDDLLPYSDSHDNLVFDAPLASLVTGRRMRYLRGWAQYASCVKCFNGLGLLGEHILRERRRLQAAPADRRRADVRAFLASRRRRDGDGAATAVFSAAELDRLDHDELDRVDLEAVAIWKTYATRPIVCSTSSNMGISLHEALRFMQKAPASASGRSFTILNDDEGWLIIWCPDEQADFMNPEKTEHLRALETESPPLTVLHTYINRKQRDPGALKDALDGGGYFFPTNPQSADEMQNLLANSLSDMARERRCTLEDLLADEKVRFTLGSLGCAIDGGHVIVRNGVEGGLFGLMAGYLAMLDETLPRHDTAAISTWNQASIGAALAAAVLADVQVREFHTLPVETQRAFTACFPALADAIKTVRLGADLPTRIHGVFDLANLQSLAQLLGVVVERHLSGRGTAFVGLGSSSYANGNRCYNVLKASFSTGGPFMGKETFHPATHTLNPVAQALVYADDLHRAATHPMFASLDRDRRVAWIMQHVRKPEPAGAAAMAGYLLARLDRSTLSLVELTAALRLAGFDAVLFLQFGGFSKSAEGTNWFLQEATEEGPYMEGFARALLHLLDRPLDDLLRLAANERAESRRQYATQPLDPPDFERRNPAINIYLTGDNTRQPRAKWVSAILAAYEANQDRLRAILAADHAAQMRPHEQLALVTWPSA
ncbi:MAG TPA: hypothetical protein VEA16_03685 [Vicinamibacterales bacterium]|nr:hypothetical protein [Vicinamibacterales bacterium]